MNRSENASSGGPDADSRWWLLLGAIPLLFVAWVSLSVVNLTTARYVPLQVTDLLIQIQGAFIVASYGLSLFAPFVVHHDRRYVTAHTGWRPSRLYYLVVLPLVNVFVTSLYLWRRRHHVGTT